MGRAIRWCAQLAEDNYMNIQPRKQAQDRLSEGQTIFGPPQVTSFETAFPQIATLKIVATESGHEVRYGDNTHTYTGSIGEYINCSNAFCDGGYHIAQLIREMVAKKETHRESTLLCKGNETSPKGHRIYKKCMNGLSVDIEITYKPK